MKENLATHDVSPFFERLEHSYLIAPTWSGHKDEAKLQEIELVQRPPPAEPATSPPSSSSSPVLIIFPLRKHPKITSSHPAFNFVFMLRLRVNQIQVSSAGLMVNEVRFSVSLSSFRIFKSGDGLSDICAV